MVTSRNRRWKTKLIGTDKFKYMGFKISKPVKLSSMGYYKKKTKRRIYNAIVRSIMTHGAETWELNKRNKSFKKCNRN